MQHQKDGGAQVPVVQVQVHCLQNSATGLLSDRSRQPRWFSLAKFGKMLLCVH